MISPELIKEVLSHADIVNVISSYLNVIKKGRNYVALCPFHDDKNPSMMISKEKQLFKCFVCQEGGNAITFVKKIENISFEEAVRKVAEISGFDSPLLRENNRKTIDDKRQPYFNALTLLNNFYQMSLLAKEGENGRQYLHNRGLDDSIISSFGIGFSQENSASTISYMQASGVSVKILEQLGVALFANNSYIDRNRGRVIFPLYDPNGQVVGFSARDISNKSDSKYINSPENIVFHKGSILYNYHNAKKYARESNYVYVVEGFMDAIALTRIGIKSVVAIMGTALTKDHISLLRKLKCEIRLCLDGDSAGQMATLKIIRLLDKESLQYRIVKRNPSFPKDADEILKQKSAEILKEYVMQLIDKSHFVLNYYRENNSLNTVEDRQKFVFNLVPYLLDIKSKLELDDYILNIARISNFEVKTIRDIVEAAIRKNANSEDVDSWDWKDTELYNHQSRLVMTEKTLIYYMLTNEDAIEYYEKNDVPISDNIYRSIASFATNFYNINHNIDINALITDIEMSGCDIAHKIIATISNIVLEKRKYPSYSEDCMKECSQIINEERKKQYDKLIYNESKKGKSDQEKLKLLLERNKKRAQQLYKNTHKE